MSPRFQLWICLTIMSVAILLNTINASYKTDRINRLETEVFNLQVFKNETHFALAAASAIARDQLVNIANQYDLDANSSCQTIVNRLGETYDVFNLTSASKDNKDFKAHTNWIIDVNKGNDHLVKGMEHIQYCLLNQ